MNEINAEINENGTNEVRRYVIGLLVNGKEEYLRELTGDDCFSDDLGHAIIYENRNTIPSLGLGEYVVEVIQDDEGWIWPYKE